MKGTKKIKIDQPDFQLPKTVIVNFFNNRQESLGVFQLSVASGPKEFQQLVNSLIPEGDREDFNFFYGTKEIKAKLETFFLQIKYTNFQANLDVIYHPVSEFKVKPITRSSSSMYGHTEAVLSLNFSPDSKNLASGSGDGTVRLWDIFTQTPLKQIKASNWVMIVLWSPDALALAYAQKNGLISVTKWRLNKLQACLGTPNGQLLLLGFLNIQPSSVIVLFHHLKIVLLRLWNTDNGVCLRSFGNHTKCITKVLWAGTNQIISASEDQRICVFSNEGIFQRQLKKHSHWVNTMSLSTDHILKRGAFEPGKQLQAQDKQKKALQIYKKAIEHHGQRLVSGSDDFTLMLFYLPSKVPAKQMIGHGKPINHVQFSPDGRYIISGSFDKKIKLWDGYNGDFMCTFDGHVGPVYLLNWSVDSRYIISGSQDSTLKLWDIKTRKLMMDLPGHADQIFALDWDVNGRLVASGGKDRQVKLWTN